MPHGRPDWLLGTGRRTTYRWAEFDELAARLGSIVNFDRRGDVMFLESFEDGLARWETYLWGKGASIDLSVESSRSGAFSLRMVSGSDSTGRARLAQTFPLFDVSAFGWEFSFTLHANLEEIVQSVTLYDGATMWPVWGRYVHSSGEAQIHVPSGSWQTIHALVSPLVGGKYYHTWKLAGDPITGRYLYSVFNGEAVDLSDYALDGSPTGVSPRLMMLLDVDSPAGSNATVYVDDIILTRNEL